MITQHTAPLIASNTRRERYLAGIGLAGVGVLWALDQMDRPAIVLPAEHKVGYS